MPWKAASINSLKPKAKLLEMRQAAHKRGYDYKWSKATKWARNRDLGLCQPCKRMRLTVVSELTDHIIPLHVRPDWRLLMENLESQCRKCHREKTNKDNEIYGSRECRYLTMQQRHNRCRAAEMNKPPSLNARKIVVFGPPCGGKSTYVKQNRQPGDLIFDYDEIAASVASTTMHNAPLWAIGVIEQMRTAFIESTKDIHAGTVWVIACMPELAERCSKELDAEILLIAPAIEECLRRARTAGRSTPEAIREWYERKTSLLDKGTHH